jgi:hypothetical protein
MAAIVAKSNARATWPTALAGVRATSLYIGQRTMACAAATVMICAVGAALVQLVTQILSFPAPIAAPAITLLGAALLNSLRRHLRTQARHRSGRQHPHSQRRRVDTLRLPATTLRSAPLERRPRACFCVEHC